MGWVDLILWIAALLTWIAGAPTWVPLVLLIAAVMLLIIMIGDGNDVGNAIGDLLSSFF